MITHHSCFTVCLPRSVLWLPGTAEVRRSLHADDVRLPDTRPRAQTRRLRVADEVRVRRPARLAKHRDAGEQSGGPESRPQQAGAGHLHLRPDLEDRKRRQDRRAARQRRRSRRGGHVHQDGGSAGLLRDLPAPGRQHGGHFLPDVVQVI